MKNILKKYKFVIFTSFLIYFGLLGAKAQNYYGDYKSHKYYKYLDEIGKKIIDRVDNSKKIIYIPQENTPFCKSNPDYWGYVNWPYEKVTEFGICTYRIMKESDYKNISFNLNNVIRHEAMHSAQFCRFPGLIALKPIGIDLKYLMPYEKYVPNEGIYKGIPYEQKIGELEAYYGEDNPYFVLSKLNQFCY